MLKTHLNNFFCYLGRDIKNKSNLMRYDYYKVKRVIKSCQCEEHLDVANKLITLFYIKWDNNNLLKKLEKTYSNKKSKLWY
tara:strand:- start:144 stop:386 length:243 start_codon:yes stop_codon:yes gene_type:complete